MKSPKLFALCSLIAGVLTAGLSPVSAQTLKKVDVSPTDLGLPAGTYTPGAAGSFTISGYGIKPFASVTDADQPGDAMTFAYEEITGDFDKKVNLKSLVTDPADPVDNWARAGLMVRTDTNSYTAVLKLVAGNPAGANSVRLTGRGVEGQNYTIFSREYAGVKANLPNQWLRLCRVGDYFAAFVGVDGATWSLIGERYQQFPAKVLVGAYAAASTFGGMATAQFGGYGDVVANDAIAPRLVSGGTIDKKLVGVKFSEAVTSASALNKANYAISQGTINSVKMGIGGDSVYLSVSGVTADAFTVTVLGGVKDAAGNTVAAGSTVSVKALNWFNADSGFIQSKDQVAGRPTEGDDPHIIGQAVAVSSEDNPEFEIVGGGSNIWDGGDYMHYIYTQIPAGDFDYAIEVSRYDRPANTAGWGNSGIHIRPSVYRTDDPNVLPFTQDGTKVNNLAEVTYMENGAPGRAGIGIWRTAAGGGYGAGGTIGLNQEIGGLVGAYGRLRAKDAAGAPMLKTSPDQNIWLRMQRKGSVFNTYVSYNGLDWVPSVVNQDRPDLVGPMLLGLASHGDTGGSAPPNNAYGNNGYLPGTTDQDRNQNDSNYYVQRVKVYPHGVPAPVPVQLAQVDIAAEDGSSLALPGSYTVTGTYSFDLAGGGTAAFRNAGDELTFAYEEVTGDFDKQVRVTSISTALFNSDQTPYVPAEGEVLPTDGWAQGGLMVRETTNNVSPSILVVAGNPAGANEARVMGRGLAGQNYTMYSRSYTGVTNNIPNQWLRLRRVGSSFSAYVGTNGVNWTLIGQRYQEMPSTVVVGAYAAASLAPDDATNNPLGLYSKTLAKFADYKNVDTGDVVPPQLVSAGTLDKKTIGVKFSEPVSSATATLAANYKLSQGTVSAARLGIGGDSVYLTVSGLTADTFTLTVNGVKDTAGNAVAANSVAQGKVTGWVSEDVGLIQNPNARPTPGDDPYRKGQAVAVSSDDNTEIEIIGGGSNAWNPGDYIHYLHHKDQVTGDFDVAVAVSRYDRPANTAGWGNSGLMLRESVYVPGEEYTQEGTKAAMVANTTYLENSGPGRGSIPLWRAETHGNYGNGNAGFGFDKLINGIKGYYSNLRGIDAGGTVDPASSADSARWLRIQRAGNTFTFLASWDGKEWTEVDHTELALPSSLLLGFSTMSDTGGSAPPNNGYGGNGHTIDPNDPLAGQQNESNYAVQRIKLFPKGPPSGPLSPLTIVLGQDGKITVTWTGAGTLQSAATVNGPWSAVANATNPYVATPSGSATYYRLAQ